MSVRTRQGRSLCPLQTTPCPRRASSGVSPSSSGTPVSVHHGVCTTVTVTLLLFENTRSLTTEEWGWGRGLSSCPQVWGLWLWPPCPPVTQVASPGCGLSSSVIKQHLPPPGGPLQRASQRHRLVLSSLPPYQKGPLITWALPRTGKAPKNCACKSARPLGSASPCHALFKCYEGAHRAVPRDADGFNTAQSCVNRSNSLK